MMRHDGVSVFPYVARQHIKKPCATQSRRTSSRLVMDDRGYLTRNGMRTKICDTTHKTRNVGSLAVIVDPTPLIWAENVGSQSALFASPSLTVCGARHLVLEPQESLGVVVEDLVDVHRRQARPADAVERLPVGLEGEQDRNGMKLASELLLYQTADAELAGV
jgi:hypothetical protein